MKYLPIFVAFFVIMSGSISHAQNFDKYLKKYQKYYDAKKYDKAIKTNNQLKAKSIKKLGEENRYLPWVFLNEIELQLPEQIIVGIDSILQKSITISENPNGLNSPKHLQILLKSMDFYAKIELWKQVEILATGLDSMTNIYTDPQLSKNLKILLAKTYLEQGFYLKSLKLISELTEEARSLALDPKGKKDEKELIKLNYATLLNLATENYLLMGALQKADSVLNTNDEWIDKNLSKKDEASVYQELLFAQLNDKRHDFKAAEKYYESAYSHAKSGRKNHEPFVLKIHEQLILAYARYGKTGKTKSEIKTFSELVSENYSDRSYWEPAAIHLELQLLIAEKQDPKGINSLAQIIYLDSVSLPQFHQLKLDAAIALYDFQIGAKQIKDARKQLEYIIEANRYLYGEKAPKFHGTQLMLAKFYIDNTNEIARADSIYKRSWGEIIRPNVAAGYENYISILNDLAAYYQYVDEFEKANVALELAAQTSAIRHGQSSIEYALQINKIAELNINTGAYQNADKMLQISMKTFDEHKLKGENALLYTKALETEARLYAAKGMFDEAEDDFKKIEKTISKVDKTLVHENTADMARINFQLGNYTKAEKLAKKEISNIENAYGQGNKYIWPMLEILGKIKLKEGDYAAAEKMAHQMMDLTESIYGKNSTRTTPALLLLAAVSSSFGDYDNSNMYLQSCKDILIRNFGNGHIMLAEINTKLGINMMNKGENPQEAAMMFNDAKIQIANELGVQSPIYADVLKKLAIVKIQQNEYPAAFENLQEAEAIWIAKAGKNNNINAAEIYVLLGDAHYMLKNYPEAESYYDKSKKLYRKFFSERHPEYVKVQARLSRLQYMTGEEKEAMDLIEEVMENYGIYIQQFFPALSEREKARFWNKIKDDYEYYNTIVLKQIDNPEDKKVAKLFDNALKTKAILLNNSMKIRSGILNSGDTILISQYEAWVKSKELLAEEVSKNASFASGPQFNIDSLTMAIEALEKGLSLGSELFSASNKQVKIDWKDIKSALKKNEAAVEMLRFRHFDHVLTDSIMYAALILENHNNSDRPKVVVLNNGNQLEQKYFKYYKNMIRYRMTDEFSYAQYWKPISDQIQNSTALYFSPDGVYSQMNLEAIPSGEDKYVIDDANIILVNNTKDIYLRSKRAKKEVPENNAIIFGDPVFYVSIDPKPQMGHGFIQSLPGTKKEVKKLSELLDEHGWKTNSYVRGDANEEEVKLLKNPRVFHIATHGFYTSEKSVNRNIEIANVEGGDALKNPLHRSGLLLTNAGNVLSKTNYNFNLENGILTAYEAMNLNLDYTDLVVLSACETGVGDITAGDGVYGLQRAFLIAGAKTLIMSMFNVSDEATNQLMVAFYNKWLTTGQMRLSFIDAKKELRQSYPDPAFWGAFVMLGLE